MMEWCHTNWISAGSLHYSRCFFPSKWFSIREITSSTTCIELLPSSGNETFQTRSFHIISCQRDKFHHLKGIIFFHLQYIFIQKLPSNMEKARRETDCTLANQLIIHMKKLLDSDWVIAVQFKCNTSAKSVTPVQITHRNSGLWFVTFHAKTYTNGFVFNG